MHAMVATYADKLSRIDYADSTPRYMTGNEQDGECTWSALVSILMIYYMTLKSHVANLAVILGFQDQLAYYMEVHPPQFFR